jgi:hypothetical protein
MTFLVTSRIELISDNVKKITIYSWQNFHEKIGASLKNTEILPNFNKKADFKHILILIFVKSLSFFQKRFLIFNKRFSIFVKWFSIFVRCFSNFYKRFLVFNKRFAFFYKRFSIFVKRFLNFQKCFTIFQKWLAKNCHNQAKIIGVNT